MRVSRLLPLALGASALVVSGSWTAPVESQSPTEAPTGFDNQTNGFVDQATFDDARADFADPEDVSKGLGPLYNSVSCAECHGNPVTGGLSQITELRAGHFNGSSFVDHPGGSLINDRAIDAAIQERVLPGNEVQTFRTSLNTLGDGYIECIDSNAIAGIAGGQPGQSFGLIRGQFIQVPVDEAGGQTRGARFGWKNQHASLVSFAADAYLNEMGITNPLHPTENTSMGKVIPRCGAGVTVGPCDPVADPEDQPTADAPSGKDVESFAKFMRSTKAPPRDAVLAATPDAQAGSQLFDRVGCAVCHVRSFVTLPPGTSINRGAFVVPPALGNKVIHPFSDFLLHNVGTGDGIVQNGGASTRNKLRTPPLWGLRTRSRLLHNGLAMTRHDAILAHTGEAIGVLANYLTLSSGEKRQLLTFLDSL
jgi:CxxC motif-containing protein (DUF1111 family)